MRYSDSRPTELVTRDVPDVTFAEFRIPDVVCRIPEPDSGFGYNFKGELFDPPRFGGLGGSGGGVGDGPIR